MSIELNWETLTGGPDGAALAEGIRDFIHTKFQSVPLPRFIKSVRVHEFHFGSIPPDVVLKDICDPLPDFYEDAGGGGSEDDDDDEEEEGEEVVRGGGSGGTWSEDNDSGGAPLRAAARTSASASASVSASASEELIPDSIRAAERRRRSEQHRRFGSATEFPFPPNAHIHAAGLRSGLATPDHLTGTPFLGLGTSTPGIPGGTSNLHYLQAKLAPAGWSGTQTPLAAVAGAQHLNGWLDSSATAGATPPPPSWPPYPQQQQQQQQRQKQKPPKRQEQQKHQQQQQQYPQLVPPRRQTNGAGLSLGLQNQQQQQQQQQRGRLARKSSQSDISLAEFSPSTLAPPQLNNPLREKHSVSTLAPTSTSASRPPTRDATSGGGSSGAFLSPGISAAAVGSRGSIYSDYAASSRGDVGSDDHRQQDMGSAEEEDEDDDEAEHPGRYREPRPEDMQAVFRIRYAGDVRLMLTAEILLDYPMPSFVGIPVKLNITGLTFDGVGVVAYIRKRVHFCFLSPEDAAAAVGADDSDDGDDHGGNQDSDMERGRGRGRGREPGRGAQGAEDSEAKAEAKAKTKGKVGGLLQEIRVESEIGQREGTKQSLKNVGKVERFVLEQVRRIFEDEFVYPSFWTFLV